MIVDTSALLAFYDRNEPRHHDVASCIMQSTAPLIVSPYVIAELDYLVLTRHGSLAEQAVLEDLTAGGWYLAAIDASLLRQAAQLAKQYSDFPLGITDASNIVLAQEYRTSQILTLDRRHFTAVKTLNGNPLHILPE
ncbi:MAG: PIN domain-containing protein [Actinomycetaceae bacterium]|nr:PIN domain-containing protein [Actinomycetaceae bacterium]